MRKNIHAVYYFLIIILLCLYPAHAFTGAWAGAVLWATSVLPALFPFFVVSSLLQSTGVFYVVGRYLEPVMRGLFRLPGACGGVMLLSMMAGSPSGARMTGSMYDDGLLTKDEVQRLASFTTNCGPSFLLGTVGVALLRDINAGLCVLIAHYLGAVLNGLLFRFYRSGNEQRPVQNSAKRIIKPLTIGEAVSDSSIAILTVGGFVTLFSAFTAVACAALSPIMIMRTQGVNALFCSFMEMVSGCSATAALNIPLKTALVCAAASFGGLSVWAQSMAFLRHTEIKPGLFLFSKLTHAIFSFGICCLIMPVIAAPAWMSVASPSESSGVSAGQISVIVMWISTLCAAGCCFWAYWCKRRGYPYVSLPYDYGFGAPPSYYSPPIVIYDDNENPY